MNARTPEQLAEAVTDQPQHQRYELDFDGDRAFIDYRRNGGTVAMLHAEVPPHLGGRGIGTALVRGALRLARAQGLKVQPYCSFVAATMRRHPEW